MILPDNAIMTSVIDFQMPGENSSTYVGIWKIYQVSRKKRPIEIDFFSETAPSNHGKTTSGNSP